MRLATLTVALGLFASAASAGAADAEDVPDVDEVAASATSVSELVDRYEQHDMFRGINNAELPTVAAEGLELGIVTVLPASETPGVLRDGYVDYGSLKDGARLIASSDGDQMDRFGIVIDEGGPDRYILDTNVPEGSSIEHTGAGTIEVTSTDGRTTTLAPAIAVDAAGTRVPARYTLSENQMVIDVDLTDAELPVLVDPVSANRWWGHEDWYSIRDVRWQASWWNVGWIVKKACAGNAACIRLAGAYTSWVYNTWMHAKNTGQCIHMKQLWTGQVIGISAYRCNWY